MTNASINPVRKAPVLTLELQILTVLRAFSELAGMFLLAQGALHLLTGKARDKNIVYQLFCIITRPVISAARFMVPRVIASRFIPFVAFFLLFWFWILLAY